MLYAGLGVAAALVSVAFTEALLLRATALRSAARSPGVGAAGDRRPRHGRARRGRDARWSTSAASRAAATACSTSRCRGTLRVKVLLVLVRGASCVATVFSYSSGGAGGIFAPALFIGAMLGGAFGSLDSDVVRTRPTPTVGAFALVGMGAVFTGIIRAPITRVLIIVEMTCGYGLILPLMIANMTAYVLARHLRPDADLRGAARAGRRPAPCQDSREWTRSMGCRSSASSSTPDHTRRSRRKRAPRACSRSSTTAGRQEVYPVLDAELRLIGIITLDDVTALAAEPELGGVVCAADIMRPPVALRPHDLVSRALDMMTSMGVRELPVVDGERRVIGLVDEAAIAREFMRARRRSRGGGGVRDPGRRLWRAGVGREAMAPSSDRERARAIVLRHGRETVVFQGLGEEFRYWFDPDLDACVAYVDTRGAWVAAGGPTCAVVHRSVVAEKFATAARAAGRGACFFCVDHPTELGPAFAALRLGENAELDSGELAALARQPPPPARTVAPVAGEGRPHPAGRCRGARRGHRAARRRRCADRSVARGSPSRADALPRLRRGVRARVRLQVLHRRACWPRRCLHVAGADPCTTRLARRAHGPEHGPGRCAQWHDGAAPRRRDPRRGGRLGRLDGPRAAVGPGGVAAPRGSCTHEPALRFSFAAVIQAAPAPGPLAVRVATFIHDGEHRARCSRRCARSRAGPCSGSRSARCSAIRAACRGCSQCH